MNGWKLVPVEPDLKMCNAAWAELDKQDIDIEKVEIAPLLKAAIEAAPQPPSVGGEVEVLVSSLERFESNGEDFVKLSDVRDISAMIRQHVTALSQQLAAVTAERDVLDVLCEDRFNEIAELQGNAGNHKLAMDAACAEIAAQAKEIAELRALLPELLADAYEGGYQDGQAIPNGYGDKEERDALVSQILKRLAKQVNKDGE